MIDTPRTDDKIAWIKVQLSADACDKDHPFYVLDQMAHTSRELERELADMKTMGVIEVAIRNPNVSSFVDEKEQRIAELDKKLAEANQEALQVYSTYSISEVMGSESINKIWNRGERISRHKKGNEK